MGCFGIGNNFPRGAQIDYVLGHWTEEEQLALPARVDIAVEMIKNFCLAGVQDTMNRYNNK